MIQETVTDVIIMNDGQRHSDMQASAAVIRDEHLPARTSTQQMAEWMERVALKQDRQAFERLYWELVPRLKSYMKKHGADPAEADDLAQETMVQVWRKASLYDPSRATATAWIYRIARNLQIDKVRRRKLHEVELTAEIDRADESLEGHERALLRLDAARLRNLVEALPEDQLDVVRLAFFEGMSHSEIVEHLSIPLGTVKSRLRLAFGKLRTAME